MVANCEQVVVYVFEDGVAQDAIETGCVAKTVTVMKIACRAKSISNSSSNVDCNPKICLTSVNKEQVSAVLPSLLLHVLSEAGEVAPIGTIVLLLEMSFEPTVRVGSMEEVELSPFKGTPGLGGCALGAGLHATNIASEDSVGILVAAAFASEHGSRTSKQCYPQFEHFWPSL